MAETLARLLAYRESGWIAVDLAEGTHDGEIHPTR
jgi:hypothetical protein